MDVSKVSKHTFGRSLAVGDLKDQFCAQILHFQLLIRMITLDSTGDNPILDSIVNQANHFNQNH